jgi:hypothetical protein
MDSRHASKSRRSHPFPAMTSLAGDVTDFVHAGGTDGSPQVIEDREVAEREGGGKSRKLAGATWISYST